MSTREGQCACQGHGMGPRRGPCGAPGAGSPASAQAAWLTRVPASLLPPRLSGRGPRSPAWVCEERGLSRGMEGEGGGEWLPSRRTASFPEEETWTGAQRNASGCGPAGRGVGCGCPISGPLSGWAGAAGAFEANPGHPDAGTLGRDLVSSSLPGPSAVPAQAGSVPCPSRPPGGAALLLVGAGCPGSLWGGRVRARACRSGRNTGLSSAGSGPHVTASGRALVCG